MYTCTHCNTTGLTDTNHARTCAGIAPSAIVAASRPTWYPQTAPSGGLTGTHAAATTTAHTPTATTRQIEFLASLAKQKSLVIPTNAALLRKSHASKLITSILHDTWKQRVPLIAIDGSPVVIKEVTVHTPPPTYTPPPAPVTRHTPPPAPSVPDMLPRSMVDMIPVGRYAVLSADRSETIFIRINRPETGRYRGWTQITSKHSDSWQNRWAFTADGRAIGVMRYGTTWGTSSRTHTQPKIKGTLLSDILIEVISSSVRAAALYIEKVENECVRCGRELTDARSRYYHIGPECESKRPDIIDYIIENKGPFIPGVHK